MTVQTPKLCGLCLPNGIRRPFHRGERHKKNLLEVVIDWIIFWFFPAESGIGVFFLPSGKEEIQKRSMKSC